MIPPVQHAFDRLESRRNGIMGRVRSQSQAQQTFTPGTDQWSMLQVIEHLVLAEEATLGVFEKGPPPDAAVTIQSRLKLRLIYAILGLGIRVKVPMRALAPTGAPLPDLDARWQSVRQALSAYLNTLTPDDLGQPRFRHPVAGWLTIGQGLDFLARHIAHHERQLHRISRAPGFPNTV